MMTPIPICRVLLRQAIAMALFFDLARAGSNIAARMAMMAITTNSSISVNPAFRDSLFKSALCNFALFIMNDSFGAIMQYIDSQYFGFFHVNAKFSGALVFTGLDHFSLLLINYR